MENFKSAEKVGTVGTGSQQHGIEVCTVYGRYVK